MITLPSEFIPPNYRDGSVANVPATIAALLGVPYDGLPPLAQDLLPIERGSVRRVVTLLVDALGWNLLQKEGGILEPLLGRATAVSRLTSIFPSTTVAALSSLWTGAAPIQHGLVGLRLFLREFGVIGQFLSFSPTFGKYPEALVAAGLEPQRFLQWPGLADQLAAGDVSTHAFRGWEIVDSTLSRMHGRGVAIDHGAATFTDMLLQIRRLLEDTAGRPLHVAAYWPSIDTLSHIYGWSDEIVAAELRALVTQIDQVLLEALSPAARQDTLLLILADHGQVVSPPEGHRYLEDYPPLPGLLLMPPTGEPRVAYLFARHGARDELLAGLNQQLGEALIAWPVEEALAAGLFGPPPYATEGMARLGDIVAAMRAGHTLFETRRRDQRGAERMLGRHGSLTEAEMYVPLIALRLG